MGKVTSLRYYVLCYYCHKPVLIDQPANSEYRIVKVICNRCLKMLRENDTRLLGIINERERKRIYEGLI